MRYLTPLCRNSSRISQVRFANSTIHSARRYKFWREFLALHTQPIRINDLNYFTHDTSKTAPKTQRHVEPINRFIQQFTLSCDWLMVHMVYFVLLFHFFRNSFASFFALALLFFCSAFARLNTFSLLLILS